MNTVPVIRIEIERMRQTMSTMLSDQAALVDAELQAALDRFCQPDNIKRVVQEAAHAALKSALTSEISNFFHMGAGRRTLAAEVQQQLAEMGLGEGLVTDADMRRALEWFDKLLAEELSFSNQQLDPADYQLAKKLYENLGWPVPTVILDRQP
jgi:hypothetical protein